MHGETKHAAMTFLADGAVLLLGVAGIITSPAVILVCTAIAARSFIVVILGVAQRRSRSSAALSYLSDAALPIYILHQPAIVLVGYFVVARPLGILTKFTLIVIGAAATSSVVYHWPMGRSMLLRLLAGMPLDGGAVGSPRRLVPASVVIAIVGTAVCTGAEPNDTPEGL